MPLPSDSAAIKNLLKANTAQFHLIHQFNINPAGYAHPTWFEKLVPPGLIGRLIQTRRGVCRLSQLLLQRHGLHGDTCYDFGHRWWRFALLPVAALSKLTLYCGLAALHRQIAVIVDKRILAHVKGGLNDAEFLFAVKRAPLLIGQNHGLDLHWDNSSDLSCLARQYGVAYFLSHFNEAPQAIRARLLFKFALPLPEIQVRRPAGTNGWPLFKRILIHEIEPQWLTLFS